MTSRRERAERDELARNAIVISFLLFFHSCLGLEELYVFWVPVECGGLVNQGPNVRDEKLLGLLLFYVFELQFREFLGKEDEGHFTDVTSDALTGD